jgi:thiamine biosynthesis lipoprotein ApbE
VSRFFLSKIIALLAGLVLTLVAYNHNQNSVYVISGNAYGTSWSISSSEYIADNHNEKIRQIIKDIDYIASNYKSESEISQINMNYSQYQFISKDL